MNRPRRDGHAVFVDDDLSDVLPRAFADDPADRYDSSLKFADALRWAVRE